MPKNLWIVARSMVHPGAPAPGEAPGLRMAAGRPLSDHLLGCELHRAHGEPGSRTSADPARVVVGLWWFGGVLSHGGIPKWLAYAYDYENPMKMDDLGVPLFQESTISMEMWGGLGLSHWEWYMNGI